MKSDIEIAQSVELKPITEVVEKVGIGFDDLELYGKYKAKLSFDKINAVKDNKPGKLIWLQLLTQHQQVRVNQPCQSVLQMLLIKSVRKP